MHDASGAADGNDGEFQRFYPPQAFHNEQAQKASGQTVKEGEKISECKGIQDIANQ